MQVTFLPASLAFSKLELGEARSTHVFRHNSTIVRHKRIEEAKLAIDPCIMSLTGSRP